ncbi:MAG: c-type cytochrome, partial [Brasilonema sp.]
MDNQITKLETLIWRVILTALMILLVVVLSIFTVRIMRTADPYVKSVLSLKGDPALGHAIFQINCAGCHGWEADGRVGPSLQGVSKRKSTYGLIH